MKRIIVLLFVFMLGSTGILAFENEKEDPVIPLPVLRAQIVELLPSDDFGLLGDKIVKIYFTYNTSGEIVVLRITSKNAKIKKYINRNLNHKKVDLPGEVGKVYYLPLKIKVIG